MQNIPAVEDRQFVTKIVESADQRYGSDPNSRSISNHIKYGIINIDKHAGPSSHEVVAWIKRIMRLSHAGHGGTLETS